jgi:putative FmdB family regulatory protein
MDVAALRDVAHGSFLLEPDFQRITRFPPRGRACHRRTRCGKIAGDAAMPIYEFYCAACHTIYSFFSSRVDPDARPAACPGCGGTGLERKPSSFAAIRGRGADAGDAGGEGDEGAGEPSPFGDLDERRLEGAMDALAGEMGALEESEDPRQMARFFRRFSELAGMEAGPRLEDMLRRLERGEDPEALEDEMGDLDDDAAMDDLLRVKKVAARLRRKPRVDPTLHFL